MDTPRPASHLQPNARVAVAAGILFVGILAALLFRSEVPHPTPPATTMSGEIVRRETFSAAEPVAPTSLVNTPHDLRPRLTGTIEQSPDESSSPPLSANEPTGDPSTSDPGNAAPWRVTDLGKSPLPGGAGIVPRDPEGTVYGTRRVDEARRTHMIVDGDTLFYLAERYLGDGERYLEIFEANRDVLSDPDLLVLGAVLRLPSADTPAPSPEESLAEAASSGSLVPVSTSSPVAPMTEVAPPAAPPAVNLATPPPVGTATTVSVDSASFARPQTYRVRAGDTLVDISRRVYGDARRYLEIYEANRDRLRRPQDLREGVILVIP